MSIKTIVQNLLSGMTHTGSLADRREARELLARISKPKAEYAAPRRAKKGGQHATR